MSGVYDENVIRENQRIYEEEFRLASGIRQINRHSTAPGRKWFGPDSEPAPAGVDCPCAGCAALRVTLRDKTDVPEVAQWLDETDRGHRLDPRASQKQQGVI